MNNHGRRTNRYKGDNSELRGPIVDLQQWEPTVVEVRLAGVNNALTLAVDGAAVIQRSYQSVGLRIVLLNLRTTTDTSKSSSCQVSRWEIPFKFVPSQTERESLFPAIGWNRKPY